MHELLAAFIEDARDGLAVAEQALLQLDATPDDEAIVATAFRAVHGIKGSSLFLPLPRLACVADAAESVLARAKGGQVLDRPAIAGLRAALDRIRLIAGGLSTTLVEPPRR